MPLTHYNPYSALVAMNIGISTGVKEGKIGHAGEASQSSHSAEKDYKLHQCEVSTWLSVSNAGSLGAFVCPSLNSIFLKIEHFIQNSKSKALFIHSLRVLLHSQQNCHESQLYLPIDSTWNLVPPLNWLRVGHLETGSTTIGVALIG